MRRTQRGFTLMELMVVIVIVAILAAVAVPLYINYVKDAQRTEAKGAIGAVITAQQTYFQQHDAYVATTLVANPVAGDPTVQGGLNCDLTEALVNWGIVTTTSGTGATATYTVTATGKAGTAAANLTQAFKYSRTPAADDGWNP
jgi:prepilin-type N-terminal cleavage/methylation domain-containing protein